MSPSPTAPDIVVSAEADLGELPVAAPVGPTPMLVDGRPVDSADGDSAEFAIELEPANPPANAGRSPALDPDPPPPANGKLILAPAFGPTRSDPGPGDAGSRTRWSVLAAAILAFLVGGGMLLSFALQDPENQGARRPPPGKNTPPDRAEDSNGDSLPVGGGVAENLFNGLTDALAAAATPSDGVGTVSLTNTWERTWQLCQALAPAPVLPAPDRAAQAEKDRLEGDYRRRLEKGRKLIAAEDYQAAIVELIEALKLRPGDPAASAEMRFATTALAVKQRDLLHAAEVSKALSQGRKALALDDLDRAEEWLRQAYDMAPTDADVLEALEDLKEARRRLKDRFLARARDQAPGPRPADPRQADEEKFWRYVQKLRDEQKQADADFFRVVEQLRRKEKLDEADFFKVVAGLRKQELDGIREFGKTTASLWQKQQDADQLFLKTLAGMKPPKAADDEYFKAVNAIRQKQADSEAEYARMVTGLRKQQDEADARYVETVRKLGRTPASDEEYNIVLLGLRRKKAQAEVEYFDTVVKMRRRQLDEDEKFQQSVAGRGGNGGGNGGGSNGGGGNGRGGRQDDPSYADVVARLRREQTKAEWEFYQTVLTLRRGQLKADEDYGQAVAQLDRKKADDDYAKRIAALHRDEDVANAWYRQQLVDLDRARAQADAQYARDVAALRQSDADSLLLFQKGVQMVQRRDAEIEAKLGPLPTGPRGSDPFPVFPPRPEPGPLPADPGPKPDPRPPLPADSPAKPVVTPKPAPAPGKDLAASAAKSNQRYEKDVKQLQDAMEFQRKAQAAEFDAKLDAFKKTQPAGMQ